jgi:L-serine dehydratase
MISIFDIYKVGIGPSSSHTVGPMKAGKQFVTELVEQDLINQTDRLSVDVYGSLALTGIGHHTDMAIVLGLMGYAPESVDVDQISKLIEGVKQEAQFDIHFQDETPPISVSFIWDTALTFHKANLSLHENGLTIHAWHGEERLYSNTYYSIGGGFIVDESHFGQVNNEALNVPYPFNSAVELLTHTKEHGVSISTLTLRNEYALHGETAVNDYLANIWRVMSECIERGMSTEGILPGPLRVPRRAAALYQHLSASQNTNSDPMSVVDWVNMYAFAVNEENAAGGRVVTAPTNGASGIVPAVLTYYDQFVQPVGKREYLRYLATTGAIGSLYKKNASISGAEVGCQGEVGVACSMAAAGLAELMGGSPEQVCIAAEIAMEHNLGLTCDPVAGQVQVPCIERNGIAAVKAINASRMALRRSSEPRVSLDKVIETMFETGKDMNAKYRETSQGGLAVKVIC